MRSPLIRKRTRQVLVGNAPIGGGAPISVQSMTNTNSADVKKTVAQIRRLEEGGCEIIRVAVPDNESVEALPRIMAQITIPLIADIHFDYRLALAALRAGAHKIRINPGNIGGRERVAKIVQAAKKRGVPIRIGVNAGSLESDLLKKYGGPTAEALVESIMRHIAFCDDCDFSDMVLSLKASNIPTTIAAYRKIAGQVDYPLHVGITEAGTAYRGSIRSAVGIGTLLAEGIGDTIRVSLTGDPAEEVKTGFEILKCLDLRHKGITFISCPTCGRTEVDLVAIAEEVERRLERIDKHITVAVMGCAVNGPGEAKEADIGVACGKHSALLFKKGKIIEKIPESEIVARIVSEVEKI